MINTTRMCRAIVSSALLLRAVSGVPSRGLEVLPGTAGLGRWIEGHHPSRQLVCAGSVRNAYVIGDREAVQRTLSAVRFKERLVRKPDRSHGTSLGPNS